MVPCKTDIEKALQSAGVTQRSGGLGCSSSAHRQPQAPGAKAEAKSFLHYLSCGLSTTPRLPACTSLAHAPAGTAHTWDPSLKKSLQMALGKQWVSGLHPLQPFWNRDETPCSAVLEGNSSEFVHHKPGRGKSLPHGLQNLLLWSRGLRHPLLECHPPAWGVQLAGKLEGWPQWSSKLNTASHAVPEAGGGKWGFPHAWGPGCFSCRGF